MRCCCRRYYRSVRTEYSYTRPDVLRRGRRGRTLNRSRRRDDGERRAPVGRGHSDAFANVSAKRDVFGCKPSIPVRRGVTSRVQRARALAVIPSPSASPGRRHEPLTLDCRPKTRDYFFSTLPTRYTTMSYCSLFWEVFLSFFFQKLSENCDVTFTKKYFFHDTFCQHTSTKHDVRSHILPEVIMKMML